MEAILKDDLSIPEHQTAHFVKCVRYYLDYREKYGADPQPDSILAGFLAKLESKGQGLRDPASRAVRIYQQLVVS